MCLCRSCWKMPIAIRWTWTISRLCLSTAPRGVLSKWSRWSTTSRLIMSTVSWSVIIVSVIWWCSASRNAEPIRWLLSASCGRISSKRCRFPKDTNCNTSANSLNRIKVTRRLLPIFRWCSVWSISPCCSSSRNTTGSRSWLCVCCLWSSSVWYWGCWCLASRSISLPC